MNWDRTLFRVPGLKSLMFEGFEGFEGFEV